jgi:hypothetical protein
MYILEQSVEGLDNAVIVAILTDLRVEQAPGIC